MKNYKKIKSLKRKLKEKQDILGLINFKLNKLQDDMNLLICLEETTKEDNAMYTLLIKKIDFLEYKYDSLDIQRKDILREIYLLEEKIKEKNKN